LKTAALALLLAVPAAAQNRAAEIDFSNALQDAQAAAHAAPRIAAVESTLTAMNDGVGAGEQVVTFIREHGISVVVAAQREAAKTTVAAGRTVISLSDELPAYPRVYGPLIASEAARLMYADMPACAERAYMRRAIAGRVWVELGGEPGGMPVVEPLTGAKVDAVVQEIGSWASHDGAEMTLDKAAQAEQLPELPELIQHARTPADYARFAAANSRFVAFLMDERSVRQAAGLR
jgi:hypothetical protein